MSGSTGGASESPSPSFQPLRPASRGWRIFLFVAGPLLWVIALIVTAYVLNHGEAVQIALAVVAVSVLVAIVVLLSMRAWRVREEEKAKESA